MKQTQVNLSALLFIIPIVLIAGGIEDNTLRYAFIGVLTFITGRMFPLITVVNDQEQE